MKRINWSPEFPLATSYNMDTVSIHNIAYNNASEQTTYGKSGILALKT